MWYIRQERQQVSGDAVVVDVRLGIWFYHGREVNLVYVHQREGTDYTTADFQVFVRCLEVGHGE